MAKGYLGKTTAPIGGYDLYIVTDTPVPSEEDFATSVFVSTGGGYTAHEHAEHAVTLSNIQLEGLKIGKVDYNKTSENKIIIQYDHDYQIVYTSFDFVPDSNGAKYVFKGTNSNTGEEQEETYIVGVTTVYGEFTPQGELFDGTGSSISDGVRFTENPNCEHVIGESDSYRIVNGCK